MMKNKVFHRTRLKYSKPMSSGAKLEAFIRIYPIREISDFNVSSSRFLSLMNPEIIDDYKRYVRRYKNYGTDGIVGDNDSTDVFYRGSVCDLKI